MSDDTRERIVPPNPRARVEAELAFHIEMHTRDLVQRGMTPAEARRQAEASFGDLQRLSAECRRLDQVTTRQQQRSLLLAELAQDVRFAFRMLWRRRGFAVLAIATLSIGIGAATSIYSVVDGVLLRPLPYSEPDRLAAVWIRQPEFAKNPAIASFAEATPLGNEEYSAIRAETKTVRDLAMWSTGAAFLRGDAGVERIPVTSVTSSIFGTLRLRMALGRSFVKGEDVLNGPAIAVLSWEAWQSRFAGDSSVVGHAVTLGETPYTIVGVLPRGVRLDRAQDVPVMWVPALRDSFDLIERHNRGYQGLARLSPGATFASASTELSRILRAVVGDSTVGARVEEWQVDATRDSRGALFVLLGAVSLLLVIACVNVAMLMLGETANRSRELASRAALGAGQRRLVRQLLTESVVIALGGALIGSALAWAFTRGLIAMAPARLPGIDDVGMNVRVLLFAVLISAGTGIAFGLLPGLSAAHVDASVLVRVGQGQSGRRSRVLQRSLVALQLALSAVLLSEGALLARSLLRLTAVDPGFRGADVVVAQIELPRRYDDEQAARRFARDATTRLLAIPGVSQAAATSRAPFASGGSSSPVLAEGTTPADPAGVHTQQSYVAPGYFAAMGIRLATGRFFDEGDRAGSEPVAIVSEAEVQRDFGSTSAVGRRVKHQNVWRRIVGVVADVKYRGLAKPNEAMIYVPLDQYPGLSAFVLRGQPGAGLTSLGLTSIRAALREVEPEAVVTQVNELPVLIAASYGPERYRTVLVGAFAAMAVLLAAVGMYGVSARAALGRLREAGIRLALGSTDTALTRLFLADAMQGVVIGVAFGIPLAAWFGQLMRPYLFGIEPYDIFTFAGVAVFLAVVTAVASYVPSRRAASADPVTVLRSD